jgi:hypothetical protein
MILRTALLLVAVASLIAFPRSSQAAFIIHTTKASFDAATAGMGTTGFANFDSTALGNKTSSFSVGGIGFTGSTQLFPGSVGTPAALNLSVNSADPVGSTTSAPNYLGVVGGFGDFAGGSSPDFGDQVVLTFHPGSRGIGMNILTDVVPDSLSFARLAVGATTVDILNGTGTPLTGGFTSYFVGISSTLNGEIFGNATVSFVGGGSSYRIDNVIAVPEPSTIALVGLSGLPFLRRRSRRS